MTTLLCVHEMIEYVVKIPLWNAKRFWKSFIPYCL